MIILVGAYAFESGYMWCASAGERMRVRLALAVLLLLGSL